MNQTDGMTGVRELKRPPSLMRTRLCPPLLLFNMMQRPLQFMMKVGRTFDMVYLGWIGAPFYLVNDPQLVKQMLLDTKRFYKGAILKKLEIVLGKGLITLDGNAWLEARRRVQQAFSRGLLPGHQEIVVRHTLSMIDRLQNEAKLGPVDLDPVMSELMLRIALELLVGATAEMVDDMDELYRAVDVCNAYVRYRVWSMVPEKWNTPRRREFQKALRVLEALVEEVIERRQSETRALRSQPCDVLSLFLEAGFEGVELRDHVMTMMIAGHETSATAMSFLWALLAKHPDVQDQVYEEVHRSPPGVVDLGAVPFAEAIWKETLRLYPSVPILDRRAMEAVELGEYRIPAGANILWSPYCLHRKYCPNPDVFDPRRFIDGPMPNRDAYVPFGEGPRMCVGKFLADMEAVTVLALLCRAFQIEPAETGEIQVRTLVTIRPENGVKVLLHPRAPSAVWLPTTEAVPTPAGC